MTLYLYTRPIKNSLFEDFEDDFFNYPITKNHHFGFCKSHFNNGHHVHHDHCKNQITTLEKQLSRALRNNELFDIVKFSPKINISEDEKNYYIHADLPGMTKDQVKIELNDEHILTISGERKSIFSDNNNTNNDIENKDNDNTDKGKSENNEMETKNMTEEKNKNDNEMETETTENIEKKESNENIKSKETISLEENNKVKYNIMESNYGKFSRSFRIPEDADIENIHAKMENGVLEVVFNKIEPQKHQNRTIQIQ
jgi:HSP20 family molecular chaperone IbpA